MGRNTTIVICNDAFGAIDADPVGWWQQTKFQLLSTPAPSEYGFGNHANGFWIAAEHHADRVSLLAVGGNYPSVVFQEQWGNRGHHTDDDKVELLRRAAGQLGYTLVKRAVGPRRKTK